MPTPEEMIERKARREIQAVDGKRAMAEYLAEPGHALQTPPS